ncbi:MAG: hypothetical protein ACRDND_28315 [Streptosporangiaceae bacterium]
MAGLSAGGLLVQALSAPFALAADALSFLGSAFFPGRIHPAEPAPDHPGRRGALSAGARFIWSSRILRPSLACVSVINFFSFMFMALFVLYATGTIFAAVVPDPPGSPGPSRPSATAPARWGRWPAG